MIDGAIIWKSKLKLRFDNLQTSVQGHRHGCSWSSFLSTPQLNCLLLHWDPLSFPQPKTLTVLLRRLILPSSSLINFFLSLLFLQSLELYPSRHVWFPFRVVKGFKMVTLVLKFKALRWFRIVIMNVFFFFFLLCVGFQ